MAHFDPSEVALVGITSVPKWYGGPLKSVKHTDKIRGDLILYCARFAAGIGYKVVIVDSKSAKTFHTQLKSIHGAKIIKVSKPKRSPNRRKAIFEGAKIPGVKVLVMTEIEKVSLVTDCMEAIVTPILTGVADMVVPKREESLFKKTYPSYMYDSESEANLLYNEELRSAGILSVHESDIDFFFGARVFKNDKSFLKKIMSRYEGNTFNRLSAHKLFDLEEYSDSQFFPVVKALVEGMKVVSVTVPFQYPEKQKANEETGEREFFMLKRKHQRLTILIELMHFLGYIQKKKTRKIKKV